MSGVFFNNAIWQQMNHDHTEYNSVIHAINLRLDPSKFYLHMYCSSGSLTIHAYRATIEYVKN